MVDTTFELLDDYNGLLTEPITEPIPLYDFKKMNKYCEQNDKKPSQLTEAERDSFIIEHIN